MIHFAKGIIGSRVFRGTIIAVIVFAGVLTGVETNVDIESADRSIPTMGA
ncbi:MAG: hypothetical protein K8R23_09405 [Chthoniobacter sp.]|nr:hypothetical protein [Chthoniobacter sp.]